jgi:glycosyltransferase involved in cell wall biosynthesis
MTDEILVSYILPCYNTGLYIRQCIESLYRQGLDEKQFEVIFVNNATEDNSEEIVFEIRKHLSSGN